MQRVVIGGSYSDPFYTYEKGYKMCLYNYQRMLDMTLVWLHIMKGPHDDDLTWPPRGNFEIKLMNQISDSKHHSLMLAAYGDKVDDNSSCGRVTDDKTMGKVWGYAQFISLDNLHETSKVCQFIKDNCIFFQVQGYYLQ